jgi:hypothetical protein
MLYHGIDLHKHSAVIGTVVESTSGWYWLSELFRKHEIDLKLAHAFGVKAISAAKVKTDSVDARRTDRVAQVADQGNREDAGGGATSSGSRATTALHKRSRRYIVCTHGRPTDRSERRRTAPGS